MYTRAGITVEFQYPASILRSAITSFSNSRMLLSSLERLPFTVSCPITAPFTSTETASLHRAIRLL